MAQPTTPHAGPPAPQNTTPGVGGTGSVGRMGSAPAGVMSQSQEVAPAEPKLLDDLDPVLLTRLYPRSKSGEEARGLAQQAGADARDAGQKLVAAQQEPLPPAA